MSKHLSNEEVGQILYENVELKINHQKHKPNQVAQYIFIKINDLYQSGKISGDQLIILNAELQSFTDVCGACERIKHTYPLFIQRFYQEIHFLLCNDIAFGYVFSLGYYVVPVVVFIFYVLASLELIAEEIEDPFGSDANDLPTKKLLQTSKNMLKNYFKPVSLIFLI